MSKEYLEKLRDPRWQKKRLEILQRDGWRCQCCFSTKITLHVHHCFYKRGAEPWEYPDGSLMTLCESCHEVETDTGRGAEADLIVSIKQHGAIASDLEELSRAFHGLAGQAPRTLDWELIAFGLSETIKDYLAQNNAWKALDHRYRSLTEKLEPFKPE